MSKWCETCSREPYVGCDDTCLVFGKDFNELVLQFWKRLKGHRDIGPNFPFLKDANVQCRKEFLKLSFTKTSGFEFLG